MIDFILFYFILYLIRGRIGLEYCETWCICFNYGFLCFRKSYS